MNIFEQQTHNKRATFIFICLIWLVLLVLGIGFDFFILDIQTAHYFPIGSAVALLFGCISTVTSYFGGAFLVLKSSGAKPLLEDQKEKPFSEKQLENIVHELTIASSLPKPKLYIIEDLDPNAFATGRDPNHAAIAVTRGLLEKLNRAELTAVLAHEMSHIKNYDIRLMTIVAALVGGIVLLSDLSIRAFSRKNRNTHSSKGSGGIMVIFLVVWIALIIITPILNQLMAMCVSRKREYLADASAGEMTRNPAALASALEKLENEHAPTKAIKKGIAHLCIVDPLERKIDNHPGKMGDLFATHPPIQERIRRLKKMAYI